MAAKTEQKVPISGATHVERGARLDASIQKTQANRRNQLANVKPERAANVQRPKSTPAPQSYNEQGR